jgi:uncharacterized protein YraI
MKHPLTSLRRLLQSLLFVLGFATTVAHAETTIANVNCRSAPRSSASIIARIPAGSRVNVRKRASSWALIVHEPRSCWINSKYLAEQSTAEANRVSLRQSHHMGRPHQAVRSRTGRPSRRSSLWSGRSYHSPRRSTRARRAPSYDYGGSCPCSGRNICVGPRGGRYCITSGGNKRYGV